ncbi:MAG: hypothetical protein Q4D04_09545 [Clostridia bacterium]|nr:hypothetical protein [Clostridia bacterium]
MARSHSERLAVNVGAGFALKLVSQLMKFVIKTVFIYTLGMQYVSVSTLFTDILSMLALAELGIGNAITYALYKPIRNRDYPRIAALMAFYRKAYRIIAATVFIVGAACVPLLPYMVKNVPDITENISLIFMLYVVNSATSYLLVYKSTLLTASEMRWVISKTSIIFTFIRTAAECIVLLVFKNFILYLMVGIVEHFIRNYIISQKATNLYPQIKDYPDKRLEKEETRKLLADVGALSLYKISHVILTSTDSIVISLAPALGVMSVGFLGNYRLIFNTINSIVTQFYQSFVPTLGTVAASGNTEKQYDIFRLVFFVSFWMVLFCSTSLFCLSEPFVQNIWLSKRHVLDRSILFALTFNFYVNCVIRPLNAFRTGNGLFIQGKLRPVATAILNLTLDFVLVGRFGVFGVLMATGISIVCTQLWYDSSLVYKNVFKRPPVEYAKKFLARFAIAVLCIGGTYMLCEFVSGVIENVYMAFIARMLLCLLIPNGLVILLYRNTYEYRQFISRLGFLTRRFRKKAGMGKKARRAGSSADVSTDAVTPEQENPAPPVDMDDDPGSFQDNDI